MKKMYTLLVFALFLTAAHAQIVITEIMYNPPEAGTDTLEYLEIHNPTAAAVNMDGWKFSAGIKYTFAGFSLPAGGYQILAVRASAVKKEFNIQNAIQWDASEALKNTGETVLLVDGAGNFVDSVKFSNVAPWPTGSAGGGHSIVLCDPTKDNNDPANWTDAISAMGVVIAGKDVYGNPGTGCPTGIIAADDNVLTPSGKPIVVHMLDNDANLGGNFLVSISTPPAHGTATLNNNLITYTSTAGFCGNDELKYKITLGTATAEATIKIKVYCYGIYNIPIVTTESATTGVADSLNVYCELQGTVYGVNLVAKGLRFGLIDGGNNGILIQNDTASNFGYTVKEGDKVKVQGQILQLRGVTYMELDTLIKISANNPLVSPMLIDSLVEDSEGRLVKSKNALTLVDAAQWTTGVGASGFTVNATDGTTNWQIRIDNDVDLWNLPAPTNPFTIEGIGSQFDATSPFLSGYQIFPRYKADLVEIVATNDPVLSEQIQLSPNPASTVLTIKSEVALEKITLTSISGQPIFEQIRPDLKSVWNVENLPSGVYFVTCQKAGAVSTKRFVKI